MNKAELIDVMADKAGLTKVDTRKALNALMTSIQEALMKGDKVSLVGFGSFSTVQRAARTGLNPQTKAKITIPAKKVVKFRAAAELIK